ncbi:undecaprenyldiphospho-muramoylpentapeptide beta-N-acetylglucosaminyltransferase [Halorhodospira halophila]|uniref:UDP-N-acetylglucosamine--N-acetylmuramyl-(pentapeptide) pyrophosphoryl-undecaprenol N-acetylglucosamine transferase n=1 Tax=Halorhodospira halophila (strain DSM 244 / SL1) TaxID=349124 RepID=MURG_HALHL|nr:undecaprenyldiphospho-muramoylpentapeptide beta-N-acetylglucosaminyltransferase [Halorhodospira halophila]A1WYU3.1 RecName: Full=UDP-N-acetylglucosamine--N-acetylmuramyl-(pentapeptide) pyrophosphoryl-undecaprenol N-acetylglucosamine transferase; AltName: Full=Undecaprenyl-PP-MurNAc-pentapeptide-UDPGlcNAc GlcNAc transferase [Halorhodospira halophila SL1]ABM62855.1 UDP-N-acetylglucosamine--N-acetylmuramyl-(pentapeptide) pyrophosphoryl-undecaprenol N-acetylglucosamine transferase [Halorhodospira 
MSVRTVAIAAGGTGGHVYPGLAVADALRERGHRVVWLGTRAGLEGRVVPAAGLDAEWLEIGGMRGKGLATIAALPWRLGRAVAVAGAALRRQRPDVVLGMGGYVAGPVGLAARLAGRPLIIHEQNARAGMTNRFLARLGHRVLTGFPDALGARSEWVGNPIRTRIHRLESPQERYARREGAPRVLVLGGSQGARALNRYVPQALSAIGGGQPQVLHQAGELTLEEARTEYGRAGLDGAEVVPFIEDMAGAYAWADLVVARSGALTVAELAAAGVPAVLVPLPWAVDDHQTANAEWLCAAGAARRLLQPDLEQGALGPVLAELLGDRRRLAEMGEAARGVARPDATDRVATICEEVAHG